MLSAIRIRLRRFIAHRCVTSLSFQVGTGHGGVSPGEGRAQPGALGAAHVQGLGVRVGATLRRGMGVGVREQRLDCHLLGREDAKHRWPPVRNATRWGKLPPFLKARAFLVNFSLRL